MVKGIAMKSKVSMRLGLFSKIYIILALATILLIWLVTIISEYTEAQQSVIAKEHRASLREYARQASIFIKQGDIENLSVWVNELKEKESTQVAILKTTPHWLVAGAEKEIFDGVVDLTIGRHLDYPIHLYFSYNPIMKIPIPDSKYNLMIQLPQRMRPGKYWQAINSSIHIGFPIILLALISVLIYRNIIMPLKSLQKASHKISAGDFDVRLNEKFTQRQDELGDLAVSFNSMVQRIGLLVGRQRQLIQDISHELRTPITRIKLLLDSKNTTETLIRIEQEVDGMQSLLEDTLTLSWLNNERSELVKETVDLTLLIDSICDDASFEFSRNNIVQKTPETCVIENSNHRSVGQALENIIRNALKYTESGQAVYISLSEIENKNKHSKVIIEIQDEGNGIDEKYLEEIFEPFFRIDNSREKTTAGYGLGLALSKRQIEAVGGSIYATNTTPKGLKFVIALPVD